MALGSGHTEADVRGEVDWAALAAAPGPLVLHATSGHLAETASALVEHGLAPQTPAAITVRGTTRQQRTVEATLATLNDAGSELVGSLVVTVGKVVAQRNKMSWWESRALYGWTVLVPRTKDQAGEMSDRLVTHGAIPIEVPTIAVEPPAQPGSDGTFGQGPRRRPLPVGRVHLHQRGSRGVGEVRGVRSRRSCVLRREDRLCR